jgi:hypothetical protein
MKLYEVKNVSKGKVYNDFDAWCDAMAEKGCDRLEQENELTQIHVYAFRPDGRVMGVWHRPQRGNCGVAYNETDGREFKKNGRKFKHFKKLTPKDKE